MAKDKQGREKKKPKKTDAKSPPPVGRVIPSVPTVPTAKPRSADKE